MTLDTMMALGAELQSIREEKGHLQQLAKEGLAHNICCGPGRGAVNSGYTTQHKETQA